MTAQHPYHFYSGILLITGTCIGAGMLAIPLVTGLAGFFPAMAINIFCWLFMMATGLLFLEVTLWMPDGSNLFTMTSRFLGTPGKIMGPAFFLLLYYALMVSYIAGGAPLFDDALDTFFKHDFPPELIFGLFTLLFGTIVLVGAWFVDRVNWILMTALFLSYFLLLAFGLNGVNHDFLLRKNWNLSFFAAPILFSAYGYHNIIPSLSTYLKRNRKMLRLAIIVGVTLPFIVYSLWQWLVIGTVSLEELLVASETGTPASTLLAAAASGSKWVWFFALFFGFFALVTSLLGVSLSMVDFLGDALRMRRVGLHRLLLTLLVFVPPALFAYNNPGIFLSALAVAGGIGEAFLNGLLPIAMVWVGRYQMKLEGRELLFGGRPMLILLLLFTLVIMGLESYLLFF